MNKPALPGREPVARLGLRRRLLAFRAPLETFAYLVVRPLLRWLHVAGDRHAVLVLPGGSIRRRRRGYIRPNATKGTRSNGEHNGPLRVRDHLLGATETAAPACTQAPRRNDGAVEPRDVSEAMLFPLSDSGRSFTGSGPRKPDVQPSVLGR